MSDEAKLYEEVFGDLSEESDNVQSLLQSANAAAKGLDRLVAEDDNDDTQGAERGSRNPEDGEPLWSDEDDETHAAQLIKARQEAPAAWVREALEKGEADRSDGTDSSSGDDEPVTKRTFRRPLKPGILEFTALPDLTEADTPLQGVAAVQVHPGGQVAMVLASDSRLRFFQLAGESNPLLQSLLLDRFSASSAFFIERGQKVIVTGNRPDYFVFDLTAATQETHSLRANGGTRIDSMQRAIPLVDVCGISGFAGRSDASELAGGIVVFSQCGRLGNIRLTEQERNQLREDRAAMELARQQGADAAAELSASLRGRERPVTRTGSVFVLDTRSNTVLREIRTPFSDTRVLAMCAEFLLVSGEDAGGRVMMYEVRVSRGSGIDGSHEETADPQAVTDATAFPGTSDLSCLSDVSFLPPKILDDGAMRVSCIAGCGPARLFATGQESGVVSIYSLDAVLSQLAAGKTPTPHFRIKNIREEITAMQFNRTGEILALTDGKRETRFVHVNSQTVFNVSQNPRNVRCFGFSPDSSTLYLGTGWGKVQTMGLTHYR